jgi:hypothetical protein
LTTAASRIFVQSERIVIAPTLLAFATVAGAAYGLDEARLFRIVASFLRSDEDVHVNRTIERFEIAVGDFEQQVFAGLHTAGRSCQREQQVVFHRRQRQGPTVERRRARRPGPSTTRR